MKNLKILKYTKYLINLFEKTKKRKIPAYIGLCMVDPNIDQIKEICKKAYNSDSYDELTEFEKKDLQKLIVEIKNIVNNPKAPKDNFDYDLTINALISFEDYNFGIQQAPYLLACIYRSTANEIEKMANDIYNNMDFEEFWSKYIFFLTWRKWQLKVQTLTLRRALMLYRIQKMITSIFR